MTVRGFSFYSDGLFDCGSVVTRLLSFLKGEAIWVEFRGACAPC